MGSARHSSFLCAILTSLAASVWPACAVAGESDDVQAQIAQLSKKYGISVQRSKAFPVTADFGEINGELASPAEIKAYLPILASEWNLYPPELVKRAGVWSIVLCKSLRTSVPRLGAPYRDGNELYLSIEVDRYGEFNLRRVIHHEFFHMIDMSDGMYSDKEWETLNPRGFSYGLAGTNLQQDGSSLALDLNLKGFLNRYSMSAIEEDKAEIFSFMMVNGKELEEHASTDPILKGKIRRMKEILAEFCPDVNEQFWLAAREVQRPPSNWPVTDVAANQQLTAPALSRAAGRDVSRVPSAKLWAAISVALVFVCIITRAIYRSTFGSP